MMRRVVRLVRHTWQRWFRERDVLRAMEDEFDFHIAEERQRLMDEGVTRHAASALAAQRFGDLQRVRHECSVVVLGRPRQLPSSNASERSGNMLRQDIKLAMRGIRRSPGFAAIVTATLALGIGATTAVFSVVNSVILNPLPYDEPNELYRLYSAWETAPDQYNYLSGADLVDLRDNVDAFDAVGVMYTYAETGFDLAGDGAPVRIRVLPASAGYFRAYRVTPLLGRTFDASEETQTARVVVLSYTLWRNLTGSDPNIVGKTLTLSGEAYTVVGIMRQTFRDVVSGDVDAWVPQNMEVGGRNSRGNFYLTAVVRLRSDVTLAAAQAQVDAVNQTIRETSGFDGDQRLAVLVPLHADIVGPSQTMIFVLFGAAGLVLIIACVNVANLFLARNTSRQKEIAIQAALGAARYSLIRRLLTEAIVLASIGGTLGFLVAVSGVRVLLAISPDSLARAEEVSLDLRLLGFAFAITLLTGVIFGMAPALQSARLDVTSALRDGGRGSTSGRTARVIRSVLVASQVSLAVMLLTGAGLLTKSFMALQTLDHGFDGEGVATFEVHLPQSRYADPERRIQFHLDLHDRLRTSQRVQATAAISKLPGSGGYHYWGTQNAQAEGDDQWTTAQIRVVEGDYFGAMHIEVLQGRAFVPADRAGAQMVTVVNQSYAAAVFSDRSPLGHTINVSGQDWSIVGVVRDVAHDTHGAFDPKVYLPHQQYGDNRNWALTQVVRTSLSEFDVLTIVKRELAAIDPNLVVYRPMMMRDVVGTGLSRERFALALMVSFSGIALTLAALGIYGVLAYAVSQRTQEIGIRLALGARISQVHRVVVGQGLAIATTGAVVGLIAAVTVGFVLDSLVFGVAVHDPTILATVTFVLIAVAAAAGYVPARRASRVDPLSALREE